jgi:hypothetical protein
MSKCNGHIEYVCYEEMTGNVRARCVKCKCTYEHPSGKKAFSNCITLEKKKNAYILTGRDKKIKHKNVKTAKQDQMSKCELLPKGCDCGSTEAAKCQSSKKPMKSREEIEAEIERLDSFEFAMKDIVIVTRLQTLKWVLNE